MEGIASSPQNKKNISIIAGVISIIVIAALAYFLVINKPKAPEPQPQVVAPVVPETVDVTSKIKDLTNPVGEKLPDLNPVEQTNPFKNVYKNPFE